MNEEQNIIKEEFQELEITSMVGCPMNCSLCPQKVFLTNYKKISNITKLTFENYEKIINKLPKNVRIAFAGKSEPFLDRNTTEMILYAHNKRHKLTWYTTGVGMTNQDINKIKHIKFNCFYLHVPDIYGIMVVPNKITHMKTLKNIKKDNFSNLSVVAFNSDYFKKFIAFKQFVDLFGKIKVVWAVSRAGAIPLLPNWRRKGRIACGHYKRPDHFSLLPNGDVALCCMDWKLQHILGNLLTDSWEDLFKSEEYKKILRGLKDESIDIACRQCEWSRIIE